MQIYSIDIKRRKDILQKKKLSRKKEKNLGMITKQKIKYK
jgi:hypothetical protein